MARFAVTYQIRGTASEIIEGDSLLAVTAQLDKRVEDENFLPDLDDVSDINFRVSEMHPVTRRGEKIWTTYPLPSDVPGHA